ncbi:thioesterase II family protein [Nocardia sp. NPDC052566]|uniref:thioesterase II family protein n=1 Tax=Nocardia sp. NPDC052566 TaxID=3364330 RepID=UPI0037CA4ECF
MTANAIRSSGWVPHPPAGNAPVTLYCLPHAGAGASAFVPWRKLLHPEIEVVPLQPPGRELRMREQPHDRVESMIGDLLAAMDGAWRAPFALFGHSMGALVAYELARALTELGRPPVHLIVSARRAPQRPSRLPSIPASSDALLLQLIRELGGTPQAVLDDAEWRRILLRLMRADMTLNESYGHRPGPPLDIPITVLAGRADTHVAVTDLEQWARCSSGAVDIRMVDGGHFFVTSHRDEVLGHLRDCLTGPPR